MRAALLTEIGKPLELADVPVPEPGAGEVLVRTHACGICRTDLHIAHGLAYRPALPHILGHEPAGTVERIGPGVSGFAEGDRVAPYLFLHCGACSACRDHREAQCSDSGGVFGVTVNGAFADYFVARADNLVRVPPAVSLEVAGLVGCAIITSVRALARADLSGGERAAVIGIGGIGILIVQGLAARGIDVVAISRSTQGQRLGEQSGAARSFAAPAAQDLSAYDRVFDMVGTAETMKVAASLLVRGGRIVVVGEESEHPAIDTTTIAQHEIEIVGSRNGSRDQADEAMALLAEGVFRPEIARRVTLGEINEAFAAIERGDVHGRVVVDLEAA